MQRIDEQIDDLLDSKDAFIILTDGHRAIHYARGFGLSACHHGLLAVQNEHAIRGVTRAESVEVGQPVVERALDHETAVSSSPGLTGWHGRHCAALSFVILLVGLPVALVVRGVAETIGWLLARIVG